MNHELQQWLWWAWKHRQTILQQSPVHGRMKGTGHYLAQDNNRAVRFIYGYYTQVGGPRPHIYAADVSAFAGDLLALRTRVQPRSITIQSGGWTPNATDADIMHLSPRRLATGFFHFIKGDSHDVTHRLYANIRVEGRARIFGELVAPLFAHNDGFRLAKVAGPAAHRADTAVFYFAGNEARAEAVEQIRPFVTSHRTSFLPERPKLTQPIVDFPGFGLGMEPPQIQLMRVDHNEFAQRDQGQSFGTYRAHLIFMALDRSDVPALYSPLFYPKWLEFKWRAENYFRLAGINPDAPWTQEDPVDMVPLTRIETEIEALERQHAELRRAA